LWRIKLLEEAAQNIYKEWFVHFRFPDYENTEFENGLPKGWTYRKLNSLCNFIGGFAFKSKNYKETGNYKIVTIKNVTDRRFDNSKFDYISELPAKMKEACKIQEGDILLSLTGNVGRTCLAFGSNLLLNQRVCIIEPINKTNSVFVYYMFGSDSLIKLMQNLSNGVAQQNLSPVKLSEQKVLLPNEGIMISFNKIVSPIVIMMYPENRSGI